MDGDAISPSARDNFEPLESVDWQLHTYGAASPVVRGLADRFHLPLHEFAATPQAQAAGLVPDAAYLVRPDGHVAAIGSAGDVAPIERVLRDFQIVAHSSAVVV